MNNPAILFFRFLIVDILWDVVRFPVWWFRYGLTNVARWWVGKVVSGEERLALVVLMKNLGRPMFGDYTREGRAISFGVRIVQLAVSLVLFAGWFVVITLLWIAWFALLPATIALLLLTLLPNG
ncbi:MAG: hypothetical protein V1778_01195 [bacterium]